MVFPFSVIIGIVNFMTFIEFHQSRKTIKGTVGMIFSLVFYMFFLWGQFEKNLSVEYDGPFIYDFCNGLGIVWIGYFLIGSWRNAKNHPIVPIMFD